MHISVKPDNNPRREFVYAHLTDEEIEAQRGEVIWPWDHAAVNLKNHG